MKLRELAHARTGDKGDTSVISLIAHRAADYPLLCEQATAARVRAHFAGIVRGEVTRYEIPSLGVGKPDRQALRSHVAELGVADR